MRSLDDTIAAVATPPGEGGVAIVRASGPGAAALAGAVLRGRDGAAPRLEGRTLRWVQAVEPETGRLVDEALCLWMPGPDSYTREDVLEVQCHGGHAAARSVLGLLLRAGARLAEPGEFTLRAYLRGRLDLVQAEAVLDVIRARTGEALAHHQEILDGRLSEEVGRWQEDLGRALAGLEAHLDFPEEEIGEVDLARTARGFGAVREAMAAKLASYAWGRTAREGFRVVLAGAPNTGKSSLFNRLLEDERAIVSPEPGTTRDVLEAWLNALGAPVRLVDTAGLRAAESAVEQEGVRRARHAAGGAELVLLVCDGARELSDDERRAAAELARSGRAVPVVNKADLGRVPAGDLAAAFGRAPVVASARTGEGVPELLTEVRDAAWGGRGASAEAPITRERHRRAVEQAAAALERAVEVLERGGYPEVAASEAHGARRHLEELLGWGTHEDVLEAIFEEFCVGK